MESRRLTPCPSLEEWYFTGPPTYLGTPTFNQLRKEIREHAYFFAERHGWSAEESWCAAEKMLFGGFEEVGYGAVGYRVYVREDEKPYWEHDGPSFDVKVITPSFPVLFDLMDFLKEPEPIHCDPVTLCSALKKCPDVL